MWGKQDCPAEARLRRRRRHTDTQTHAWIPNALQGVHTLHMDVIGGERKNTIRCVFKFCFCDVYFSSKLPEFLFTNAVPCRQQDRILDRSSRLLLLSLLHCAESPITDSWIWFQPLWITDHLLIYLTSKVNQCKLMHLKIR